MLPESSHREYSWYTGMVIGKMKVLPLERVVLFCHCGIHLMATIAVVEILECCEKVADCFGIEFF